MNTIELITKILILISILFSFFSGKLFTRIINYTFNRERKRLPQLKELDYFIDKLGNDFKDNFIIPDLKEQYFYLRTGINTNVTSIQKYIDLKNKLGGNFTWKNIKIAKDYFILKNNIIAVNIPKWLVILTYISLGIIFALFIICIGMLIYFFDSFALFTKEIWVKFVVIEFITLTSAMFFLHNIHPALQAISIKKRLRNLN
ncbi:hypothetical protein CAPN008_21530 [Capnocytophaga canis]|uniref:hypothetical protein n=1 Tax=Capnocytophaga canis TaxID=1848903 RepID=UPI001ACA9BAB|nr:hypothetical protein [Capnocytophaga canis]GIM62103.1 hypothetical protein CAPN008_21530 [Capnocytophaga canis]